MPLKIENEAITVLKSAQLLPAAIISRVTDGELFAETHKLTYLKTEQLQEMAISPKGIADAITAEVPTARAENAQFHIFRPDISGEEHYAVEIGKIDGHQKRISAKVVGFPFYDPSKSRVRA